MKSEKIRKESRLGKISLFENTPVVFSPSPVWKLEKEYGPATAGLTTRGNIPARELKKLGVKQYKR